jgi:hypothetical protein
MKKLIMLCLLSFFFLYGSAFGAFNFIDNGNGTVTDARTGLVWLKNADPCDTKNWADARAYCNSLASGTAGLTDGSVAGQWRLPGLVELEGIGTDPPTTYCISYPCNWPSVTWTMPGAPFTGVQSHSYWSSTEYPTSIYHARLIHMFDGDVNYGGYKPDSSDRFGGYYVWPVREPVTITTTISSSTTTTAQTTAIELSSFTATPKAGTVTLQWSTESEIDNAGFNLYRSESEDGEYTKINTALILAKGSSTQGANYEFTDINVQNRKTYYYKLEDIDLSGKSTMHGPVSGTPRWIFGIK